MFNVLTSDTEKRKLLEYEYIIYFDKSQKKLYSEFKNSQLYTMDTTISQAILNKARDLIPFRYTGEVGVTVAEIDNHYLIGIFNNEGVVNRDGKLLVAPDKTQKVTMHNRKNGDFESTEAILGKEYLTTTKKDRIELEIPAGQLVVLKIRM